MSRARGHVLDFDISKRMSKTRYNFLAALKSIHLYKNLTCNSRKMT